MKNFIDNKSTNIELKSFIWNAFYSGGSALQSFVILFAVARKREPFEVGIVTIGFTIATLTMIIAIYGVRNYQVTDVKEENSFSDYFYVRVVTVFFAFLLVFIFIFGMIRQGHYSNYKGLVVVEIVVLKLIDAFENVFVGRLQQKGRLDIGAKVATLRVIFSTTSVFFVIWVGFNTLIGFFIGIIISIIIDLIMLPKSQGYSTYPITNINMEKIKKILYITMPLCIGTTLHNYIGNGPKYLVDYYLNDNMQAISGYIMMPMFVITVLNSFLMQPTVKKLGYAWSEHDYKLLKKMVYKHLGKILFASVGVFFLGFLAGLPFISLVYNIELDLYKMEFMLVMIGGTLYTISAYGMVLLTAMRQQKWILIGCLFSIIIYMLLGKSLVVRKGLMGAAEVYIFSNLGLLIIFFMGIICAKYNIEQIKKRRV